MEGLIMIEKNDYDGEKWQKKLTQMSWSFAKKYDISHSQVKELAEIEYLSLAEKFPVELNDLNDGERWKFINQALDYACKDYLKSQGRQKRKINIVAESLEELKELGDDDHSLNLINTETPDKLAGNNLLAELIINTLTKEESDVLGLYAQGYRVTKIQELLGYSRKKVRYSLNKAQDKVRKLLVI